MEYSEQNSKLLRKKKVGCDGKQSTKSQPLWLPEAWDSSQQVQPHRFDSGQSAYQYHCKESAYNVGDLGLIPGLGISLEGGHGNPLQYSCLEDPQEQRSMASYSPWGCKESDMARGGQSIGVSALASVLPKNTQD